MIRAWGITDQGKVRQQNQDAYYVEVRSEDLAVGLVCDGMGGARAGNVASLLAVEQFTDTLHGLPDELREDPEAVLAQGMAAANAAVYHRSHTDPDCWGMGTTMVAAILVEGRAYLLNVGDSRAYHIADTGIEQVTRDHSLVEDMVRRGDLTPEEARNHPQKNLITRALGTEEWARPDFYRQHLEGGSCLLLCSDGLSNVVSDQELFYEVWYGGDRSECCRRLLDIALSRGAPDNVTCVLFELE
ncbi:Stp1/IreP family PP2C-type Ser/Thr phosphatase [Pseudoflavonifractor phocaeensis]|uniref:Stp1/IreP family PP2C-type Ser/Thr phosphatase n=1 Tax=Pseudoflavonifractor phocaeensis TaxID=1870988 RepID=UPI001959AA44|nr:Stp1/IreP family PP2C-type Ser/Thr phosphatase [Pseudoflavonifractor phocaeensis]MBM6869566.1 Stp1/IreP family PP2C-type Ser/Thr phosphatase [Pseudoflavonifractor phocaeensis]MBM6938570.1 Stp1/IreP family PP2C-type Ser/Thr phosphatase [Pseudoflavonifractor phocaeensis]